MSSEPRSQVYPARIKTEDLAALKAIQARTGATIAEQIRRAVAMWLKAQKKAV